MVTGDGPAAGMKLFVRVAETGGFSVVARAKPRSRNQG
jgi:hypothetical protein